MLINRQRTKGIVVSREVVVAKAKNALTQIYTDIVSQINTD